MNKVSTKDDLDEETPSEKIEEGNILKDQEMDKESETSKWEQDPIKFMAIETTTTYMIIITNYQRPLECTQEDYDKDTYHRYPIFDLEISLREYVRRIQIDFLSKQGVLLCR